MGLSQTENARPGVPWRAWLLPLGLIMFGALAQLSGDDAVQLLRYERTAIAAGEFWRLLTGHLVHLGWSHYALNAAGLVLVWLLVGAAMTPRGWFIAAAAIALGIDLGFWLWDAQLVWYVGLSGVLHGLLVTGLLLGLGRARLENVLVLCLIAAKLGYEQWLGPLPGSESTAGGPVVVDAHFYGALAGAACAAACWIRVRLAPSI